MTKKPKTKALVVKKDKDLLWAGSKDLFGQFGSEKDRQKRDSLLVVSQALKITPFGVNMLGGLPYINNLGLKQKSLQDYHKGANFKYQWIRRSEDDSDKAICEARIVDARKKALTPWIAGEASPASMKMGTLKGYQNQMAQTRAENRAIRYLDGLRMHQDLIAEITKLRDGGRVDEKTASEAVLATTVPAEEMNVEGEGKTRQLPMLPQKSEKSNPIEIAAKAINEARSTDTLKKMKTRVEELAAKGEFSDSNKTYLLGLVARRMKQL